MNKLILTVGLPRSGKSTWALKQGHPIVNRDAIRLALHGHEYIQCAEDMVTALEVYMVRSLFFAGHKTVIVDSTHIKQKYRDKWKFGNWEVEEEIFLTSVGTCIERAKKDKRYDLIPVIERMFEQIKTEDSILW